MRLRITPTGIRQPKRNTSSSDSPKARLSSRRCNNRKMPLARTETTSGQLYLDIYTVRLLSMPNTDSLQGSLDLLVLKILSRRPRLHGYAIMTAIQAISGEKLRVEEGSLYPALHRMEEAGWIRARWVTKDSGRRARLYELTAAGRKHLGAEESRWHAATAAIKRVLREA